MLNLKLFPANLSIKVQTAKDPIQVKGYEMANQKAALHKDVARIFQGVWTPQVDNIQQENSVTLKDNAANSHPKPLTPDRWSKKAQSVQKTQKVNIPKQTAWSFFSPKARREKKRLSAISKNLIINLPG